MASKVFRDNRFSNASKSVAGSALSPAVNAIHHSDRRFQYCSNQYVEELKKNGFQISMTEENHCYENAVAERVNGILRTNFSWIKSFSI
jgi:transposase InsO family protein